MEVFLLNGKGKARSKQDRLYVTTEKLQNQDRQTCLIGWFFCDWFLFEEEKLPKNYQLLKGLSFHLNH